ncbi:PREDICTED: beta-1,3-galactosyltransferase 2-like [Nanorana parkeri]|uniref:beta-1,3-galactosyltransferase 2-like n=1 Tax=Nanorana parkeri TaxID=125878 RepID=UPI000854C6B5|nr:PREDICTED: beta-1,3-galactosyltransferase 2-like [Nanorana parkeri]
MTFKRLRLFGGDSPLRYLDEDVVERTRGRDCETNGWVLRECAAKADKKDILSANTEIANTAQSSFEWIRNIRLNIPTSLSPPAEGYININYYPYIINEANKCKNSSPFLVLIIATVAAEVENREAIRHSWGNESLRSGIPIVRLFMLGTDNTIDQNAILQESEKHHDIIQKNFHDTYRNLTIKTMMGIDWVSVYCSGAKYVMKTDSDMFVNTEHLLDFLVPNLPAKQNYVTGFLLQNHQPHRNENSKWHMPRSLYPDNVYPDFCSGTGYVFSGDVAPKILRASFLVKYVYLEDVFVGICLDKENIRITPPLDGFLFNNYKVQFSPCAYNSLITSHEIGPTELIAFWKLVQEHKVACKNNG